MPYPSPTLVVIIDDSPTIRVLLEICLTNEGYLVIGFADGIEALKWLKYEAQCSPRLVLLDLNLPQVNGYDVARTLKAQPVCQKTTIVMMSRYDGTLDRLKGRLSGAQEYLPKPFTETEPRSPPSFKRGMNGESLFGAWVEGHMSGHPTPENYQQHVVPIPPAIATPSVSARR
jgi:CheY-like chemotaxis protein